MGEARGTDTFEVIPIKSDPEFENASIGKPPMIKRPIQFPEKNIAPVSVAPPSSVSSANFGNSPLEEFLGRSPKRLVGQWSTTVSSDTYPPPRPSVSPEVIPAKAPFPVPRQSVTPAVSTYRPVHPSSHLHESINPQVRTLKRRQDGQSTFLFVSEDVEESKLAPVPPSRQVIPPSTVIPPVERNRLPGRLFDLP